MLLDSVRCHPIGSVFGSLSRSKIVIKDPSGRRVLDKPRTQLYIIFRVAGCYVM